MCGDYDSVIGMKKEGAVLRFVRKMPGERLSPAEGEGTLCGAVVETGRVSKILAFRGIERQPIDEAEAGDIIAIAGLEKFNVADTLAAPDVTEPLQAQPIDPPTLSMTFLVNDSPLAGTEGDKVTSRMIRARLMKEAEGNVALRVEDAPMGDAFIVSGRGELQLGILIETMRREGYELSVSRPKVLLRKDDSGNLEEPIEEVVIDVDEVHSGVVVQKMSERKADMTELKPSGGGRVRLVFHAPTRGLIGYQGELMTDTKGTAIMNRLFHNYLPYKGEIQGRRNGVLISNDQGEAVAYAMFKLEDRGPIFYSQERVGKDGKSMGSPSRCCAAACMAPSSSGLNTQPTRPASTLGRTADSSKT